MHLDLVSHVMSHYAVFAMYHGPYVILIHPAVGGINSIPFATVRKYDGNGLFEFHHLVTRYIITPQKRRQEMMTDA